MHGDRKEGGTRRKGEGNARTKQTSQSSEYRLVSPCTAMTRLTLHPTCGDELLNLDMHMAPINKELGMILCHDKSTVNKTQHHLHDPYQSLGDLHNRH